MPSRSTSSPRLAQPGRIHHHDRHAFDLDRLRAARRAWCRAPRVTIARSSPASRLSRLDLPTFGRPASTTWMPVRSRLPCRLFASTSSSAARSCARRACASLAMQGVDFLLRKIEHRLGQRAQFGELRDQAVDRRGEFAAERAQRRARRFAARGVDQVGHRFGLRQIELAVEKRAAREFARLGKARAGIEHGAEHRMRHHRSAVALQFEHVLAGIGMRRRKYSAMPSSMRSPRASRKNDSVAFAGCRQPPEHRVRRSAALRDRKRGRCRCRRGRPAWRPRRSCPRTMLTAWHGQVCRGRTCAGSAIAEGWKGCC